MEEFKLNTELLKKSVNYHGPLLLRRLQATRPRQWMSNHDLQQNDFNFEQYKTRSRHLTGKKKAFDNAFEIMNFTSMKSDCLYHSEPLVNNRTCMVSNDAEEKDLLNTDILLGHFMKADIPIFKRLFYQNLKKNDILIAIVDGSVNGRELPLKVVCYANNKTYNLEPLNIQVYLAISKKEDCWKKLTHLKVIVTSYELNSRIIKVSTDQSLLPAHMTTISLGYLDWENSTYKKKISFIEEQSSFSKYLDSKQCFTNPHSIKHMSSTFGISISAHFSLMNLLKKYEPSTKDDISNTAPINNSLSNDDTLNNSLNVNEQKVPTIGTSSAALTNEDLSPLSQKRAQQEGNWKPPDYIDTTDSFQQYTGSWATNGNDNQFPNYWQQHPPPNYCHQTIFPPSNNYTQSHDENSLKEQMDEFLNKLNKKPSSRHKYSRSDSSDRRSRSRSRSIPRDYSHEFRRSHSHRSREDHYSRSSYKRSRSKSHSRASRSRSRSRRVRSRTKSPWKSDSSTSNSRTSISKSKRRKSYSSTKSKSRSRSRSVQYGGNPRRSRSASSEQEQIASSDLAATEDHSNRNLISPTRDKDDRIDASHCKDNIDESICKGSSDEARCKDDLDESQSKRKRHHKKKKSHKKKKDSKSTKIDLDIPGLEDIQKKLNNYYKGFNSDTSSNSRILEKDDHRKSCSTKEVKKYKSEHHLYQQPSNNGNRKSHKQFPKASISDDSIKKAVDEMSHKQEEDLVKKILAAMQK